MSFANWLKLKHSSPVGSTLLIGFPSAYAYGERLPPRSPIGSDSKKIRLDTSSPYAKAFFQGNSAAKGAMTKTRLLVWIDFGPEASFRLNEGFGQGAVLFL